MNRIAAREVQGPPHETLLVVDAVTGPNGLSQAREFMKCDITGLVLRSWMELPKGESLWRLQRTQSSYTIL